MFWIKDLNGDLVNLAAAHCIGVFAGAETAAVDAYFGQHSTEGSAMSLFRGTREECGQYRDNLYARLREFQEANRV